MATDIAIASLPSLPSGSVAGGDILPIVDISDLTDPGGTTKGTTIASIAANNQFFNVINYGVVMDGVTNNTTAFAAVIALAAVVKGTVYIPPGTMVADPPTIPANIKIVGAGMGISTIKANSTAGTILVDSVSNVSLLDFSFTGKSNSGVSSTSDGILIYAHTADVTDCIVRRVQLTQVKADAALRYQGSGDLDTPATFWVRRLIVEECDISLYYDPDPTNLGFASYGIYGGAGSDSCIVRNNWVDGSKGKHGIGTLGDDLRSITTGNVIRNCGKDAPSIYFGYGIIKYCHTGAPCADAIVTNNQINYTNRAGIYIQGISGYLVEQNVLNNCDVHTSGLGTVGTGAIAINNSDDDARIGSGSVVGNTIIDPGFCAIYLNTYNFDRADCAVSGNSCRMTTAQTRYGVVLAGHGAAIIGNIFRGFTTDLFLYNTADDFTGDFEFVGNRCNATIASGTIQHIVYSSVFKIRPCVIAGNTFQGGTTGVVLTTCEAITLANNTFDGLSGSNVVLTATKAAITGNVSTGGTSGLTLTCTAATATARIQVTGNSFSACTTHYALTENTGQIYIGAGNDFGILPGVTTNNNNSPTITPTTTDVQWWNTTLTANRTGTISATRAYRGARIRALRNAGTPGAFTLAIVDGVSSSTIYTFGSATNGWADFEYDGTNWQFIGSGPVT